MLDEVGGYGVMGMYEEFELGRGDGEEGGVVGCVEG